MVVLGLTDFKNSKCDICNYGMMVYKPMESAQKRWKKIKGFNLLTLVVNNVEFKDGVQVIDQSDRKAA